MDRYQVLEKIGCGTFGVVYKARNKDNNEIVAIKQARVQQTYDGIPREFLREISILRQTEKFRHPNIIRLISLLTCDGEDSRRQMQLTLVFEFIEQDLYQFLQHYPKPKLPINEVKNIVLQLVCGIEFLHSLSIIHRDLKPQNVLISKEGVIKIADFGLSKFIWIQKVVTPEVITLWYRAPEVLLNCDYSNKVDVWSLGCIFAELVNRRPLFNGRTEIEQLQQIFKVVGVPQEDRLPEGCIITLDQFPKYTPKPMSEVIPDLTELGRDLFTNMLKFDLRDRITAANATEHAWFDDIITCRRPTIMTRQRHSMSLAGPIPSLAQDEEEEDKEIEIGTRGIKRKRSKDQSPEASSSSASAPKSRRFMTPKKDPPKTPSKGTPKKISSAVKKQQTPRKLIPKVMKTPRKDPPVKTPRKDQVVGVSRKCETPRKLHSPGSSSTPSSTAVVLSPRKSERLENKNSPLKTGEEPNKENVSVGQASSSRI